MTPPTPSDVAATYRTQSAHARASQVDTPSIPAQLIITADLADLTAAYLEEYAWLQRKHPELAGAP